MPRRYGYAKRGERCYGQHDWHAKGRVNVIGAIIGAVFITLSVFPCYVNSDMFDAINQHGCTVEFLPPYSPDLNPIEKKWAQVKAIRRAKRCSLDELFSEHIPYANLY